MFPEYDFSEDDETSSSRSMGEVFLFDFESQQYVLQDGRPVQATYAQAIQQWVAMLLMTELDKYRVYDETQFGISLAQFIGRKDIPIATIISEVSRQISEKVLLHPEITGASDFTMSRADGVAVIVFRVSTNQGITIDIEKEVIYSGR